MRRTLGLILIVLSGCRHGPTVSDLNQVMVPAGINTVAMLGNTTLRGELLTVDAHGLTIRTERIVFVSFARISRAQFGTLGRSFNISKGYASPGEVAKLKPFSRFPYGISHGVMQELLRAAALSKVDSLP